MIEQPLVRFVAPEVSPAWRIGAVVAAYAARDEAGELFVGALHLTLSQGDLWPVSAKAWTTIEALCRRRAGPDALLLAVTPIAVPPDHTGPVLDGPPVEPATIEEIEG